MVSVRFFAGFREKVNKEKVDISITSGTTLGEFIKILGETVPEIAEILNNRQATVAVNHEVAEMDHVLMEDDEVALFPPVSGG